MSVRLTILIRKQDHLTHEEFFDYWVNEHPKVWLSVKIVQQNIKKYSQFHVDNASTTALKQAHALPFADFDGTVNMWGNSLEEIMAVFQDEEYLRLVVPDEEKFLKRDEALLMIGRDEDKWVDGKRV